MKYILIILLLSFNLSYAQEWKWIDTDGINGVVDNGSKTIRLILRPAAIGYPAVKDLPISDATQQALNSVRSDMGKIKGINIDLSGYATTATVKSLINNQASQNGSFSQQIADLNSQISSLKNIITDLKATDSLLNVKLNAKQDSSYFTFLADKFTLTDTTGGRKFLDVDFILKEITEADRMNGNFQLKSGTVVRQTDGSAPGLYVVFADKTSAKL